MDSGAFLRRDLGVDVSAQFLGHVGHAVQRVGGDQPAEFAGGAGDEHVLRLLLPLGLVGELHLRGALDGPLDGLPVVGALAAAAHDAVGGVGLDELDLVPLPLDDGAHGVRPQGGVPWMTSMDLREAIGFRPSSEPARIAAAMSPGLPRRVCGTKEVAASLVAIW
jgi:hypothetical protein